MPSLAPSYADIRGQLCEIVPSFVRTRAITLRVQRGPCATIQLLIVTKGSARRAELPHVGHVCAGRGFCISKELLPDGLVPKIELRARTSLGQRILKVLSGRCDLEPLLTSLPIQRTPRKHARGGREGPVCPYGQGTYPTRRPLPHGQGGQLAPECPGAHETGTEVGPACAYACSEWAQTFC